MIKRYFSFFTVLCFALFCIALPVSADGMKISVGNAEIVKQAGSQTVEIPIVLSGNSGIMGMVLHLNFDSALTLKGITQGSALPSLTMTKPGTLTSPCNILWDGQDADAANGTIAVLTFEVPASRAAHYGVSAGYEQGDIYDGDFNDLSAKIQGGYIDVKAEKPSINVSGLNIGGTVSLTATLDREDENGGILIAAVFEGKRLLNVALYQAAETVNVNIDKSGGEQLKLFWWSSSGVKPISEGVDIDLK